MIGSIFLFLVGITFLISGLAIRSKISEVQKNGILTDAQVIDYIQKKEENSTWSGGDHAYDIYYYPRVKFIDSSGEEHEAVMDVGTTTKRENRLPYATKIIYTKEGFNFKIVEYQSKPYYGIIAVGCLFTIIGIALFFIFL